MKRILVIFTAVAFTLLIASAAPAKDPEIQFLKYNNDQELEALQQQIIAQYEGFGGTSQFHQIQSASLVDPATFKINI